MSDAAVKYEVGPRFSAAQRPHAADDVFEQLAAAILRGQLKIGARLPPERELAQRFHVSRIITRQAIHRLAEIGLVRVRQGGTTIILDPRGAHDLRVLDLEWRLGPASPSDVYDYTERQIMQGHAVLHIAERRGTRAQFDQIAMIVEVYAQQGGTSEGLPAFEERFWSAISSACGNRLYQFEMSWWWKLIAAHPRSLHPVVAPPHVRIAVFREIVRRLREQKNAAAFYLDMASKLLDSVGAKAKAQPAEAPSSSSEPPMPSPSSSGEPQRGAAASRPRKPKDR